MFLINWREMDALSFMLFVSQANRSRFGHSSDWISPEEASFLSPNDKSITGILLYRKGFYMQYWEGFESRLFEIYQHLRSHGQHCNVRILSSGALNSRLYEVWSARWVHHHDTKNGPSSESLIDLFETVLSASNTSHSEVSAVLKHFGKNSQSLSF